tara:strand:+ start:12224 stop:12811 length:588 start_codon:yes stop_codon:yes gene_type:complete
MLKLMIIGFLLTSSIASANSLIQQLVDRGIHNIDSSEVGEYQKAIRKAGEAGISDRVKKQLISIIEANVDSKYLRDRQMGEIHTADAILIYVAFELARLGEPVFLYEWKDDNRHSRVVKVLMLARQSRMDLWRGKAFEGYTMLVSATEHTANQLRPVEKQMIKLDIQNAYPSRDIAVRRFELEKMAQALVAIENI